MTTPRSHADTRPARPARLALATAVLLSLAAFLLLRPYEGIVHDARLYVGYALAPLDPDGVGQDIMFTLDGQASKTLYPALLRMLAQWLGLTTALAVLTYGALLLWFAAAWRVVRAVVPQTMRAASVASTVVLMASLHTFYGGASTIRFAEPFAAPRALAEALGLLAIVEALQRRWWTMVALLAVAGVVHPIMTAPVVAVIIVVLTPHDRARGVMVGSGVALGVLVALAAALMPQESMLLGRFDILWLQVLDHYHSLVLLRYWSGIDLARVVLQLVTLVIARRCVAPSAQSLVDGVVLVSVGGLVLSAIGVDVLSHRLMGQAQPWRALWLAAVASGIALAILVHTVTMKAADGDVCDAQCRLRRRMSVLLLIGAWMLLTFTPWTAVLALMAWWLWTWPEWRARDGARDGAHDGAIDQSLRFPDVAPTALGVALVIGVVGFIALQAVISWQVLITAPPGAVASRWLIVFRSGVPSAAIIVAALSVLVVDARTSACRTPFSWRAGVMSTGLSCAVLVGVLALGDQRTAYERALEGGLARAFVAGGGTAPVSGTGGPVAWPGAEIESWALLGRPSWGTVNQGVAKVFSRPLALQWGARFESLLDTTALRTMGAAQARLQRRDMDAPHLQRLCAMPDAPSTVVIPLPSRLPVAGEVLRLPSPRFEPPATPQDVWRTIDSLRLISCAAIVAP